MKKFATALLVAAALSGGSLMTASGAQADCRGVCGPVGPGGPVVGPAGPVGVGGVVGPVGVNPVVYAIPPGYPLAPAFIGEQPCYTPDGQPYYTPAGEPCLCFAPTGAAVPC
ncbi:hypothetical protein MANY_41640 [Mycolicibacterium anyangense]|jgi:hypothetical protein|uniref:Uncharacterized protein n=1 Tax=Mycolicibacterium anyangense TaxID=1431246 RepID=A0A6N4WF68_9MYCO|nr:hypothetical protein MANY_41640 [Mycolicibacterium anyangense]